jgi:drug/metabolite transporter (DMT)-like permease
MNSYLLRALIALLLAALLWAQSRSVRGQAHRRRAYLLAAGGLVAFAGYNASLAAGAQGDLLQVAMLVIGGALLIGAVVELARSFFAGELRAQRDEIAAAAKEFRERRESKDRR